MRTQKVLHQLEIPELVIPAVCSSIGLARNDQYLAIGGRGGALFIVDLEELKVIEKFSDQHSTPILGCAWDPSHGSRVASIDTLGSLFIWE
jgi:WD40 repeat protein